jgi:hypothetical protein
MRSHAAPGQAREDPSGKLSRQPFDGDDTGIGERPELRVARHDDRLMVPASDDSEAPHRG